MLQYRCVIGLNFNDEVVSESNKKHIDVGAGVLGARDGGLGCPSAIPPSPLFLQIKAFGV